MFGKKVTIVVAIYNVEKYMDKCIESICQQSYKNLEIILVDDGSIDGSTKKCDTWSQRDERIRVVHKENGGVSTARNAGIGEASGELIVFVDGDDWLEREAVTILVDNYEKGVLVTAGYYIDNHRTNQAVVKERRTKAIVGEKEVVVSLFEKGLFSPIWNKIYDLDVIRNNNITFDEKMSLGEDIVFNLTYMSWCKGKICNIDKPLYHYVRRNIESLDNKYCDRFDEIQKIIYECFFDYLGEDMRRSEQWRRIQMLYFNSLIVAIDNVYVNRFRFNKKQYKEIVNKRIFNKNIVSLLNAMDGKDAVICKIRYFFVSNHMYWVDYYAREFIKKIL